MRIEARRESILSYALKLTRSPAAVIEPDASELRAAGLSDAAIHDLAVVVAYFNFVNRMALGLGVQLESPDGPG